MSPTTFFVSISFLPTLVSTKQPKSDGDVDKGGQKEAFSSVTSHSKYWEVHENPLGRAIQDCWQTATAPPARTLTVLLTRRLMTTHINSAPQIPRVIRQPGKLNARGCYSVRYFHVLQLLPIRFNTTTNKNSCCISKSTMKHMQKSD